LVSYNLIITDLLGDTDGDGELNCEESAALGMLVESMNVTSCGPYVYDGLEFLESGAYELQYMNQNGCEVTINLELEIVTLNMDVVNDNGTIMSMHDGEASYQWIDCATEMPIDGANVNWIAPTVSGEYALQLSLGECSATSDCVEVIVLNQEELSSTVVEVFPNPSQGLFRVQMSGTTDVQYEVFDGQGAMVKAGRWTNNENILNLEGQASGVYLLKMGEQVYRLIVQ
jgi:hypothetical protein